MVDSNCPPLVVVVGPTAVGKTELTIGLAQRFDGEIVSCDSMQVYRGMNIGTAKPTLAERQGVPHHLIDVISPLEDFNVARYREMAKDVIAAIHARQKLPFLTGGTGLYVKAVLDEYMLPGDSGADWALREAWERYAEVHGEDSLHRRLEEIDPPSSARLHPNDIRRIIRALEVYESTGKPLSEHLKEASARTAPYKLAMIGLTRPREELYERINRRVDMQVSEGLIDEVRRLLDAGYSRESVAGQGLGYKEIIGYLEGRCSLDAAVDRLKRDTRRYAKRQFTWFRRDSRLRWFDVSTFGSVQEAVREVGDYIDETLRSPVEERKS